MANYWKGSSALVPVPTGCILPFLGVNVPDGWLLCDGSLIYREDYPDLVDLLTDLPYNSNQVDENGIPLPGSTAMSCYVPNLSGRTLWGTTGDDPIGTLMDAGLPNITGYVQMDGGGVNLSDEARIEKAFGKSDTEHTMWYGTGLTASYGDLTFDASKSNALYGASDTVQPPALCVNFIIKT